MGKHAKATKQWAKTLFRPSKVRPPRAWTEAYPDSTFRVIHREDYLDFIAGG